MKKAFKTYFILFILTLFSGFVQVYGNSISRGRVITVCSENAVQNATDSHFLPSSSSDTPFLSKFIVTETDSEELVDNSSNEHEDLFTACFHTAFYAWYSDLFLKKNNTVSGRCFVPELQYPKQYIRFQVFRI